MVAGATDARVKFQNERLYRVGFVILSASGIPGYLVGAKLKKCIGPRVTSAMYLLALFLAAVKFERAESEKDFLTGFGAVGVGMGLHAPTVPLVLNTHVAKERLAKANSVVDASGALARVLAPMVAAGLYDAGWAWVVGGIMPLSAVPLLFIFPERPPLGAPLLQRPSTVRPRTSILQDITLDHDAGDTLAMKAAYVRTCPTLLLVA
jgi:hypothetical protein